MKSITIDGEKERLMETLKKSVSLPSTAYISPRDLARRWCVSRSSADRIARRNGFTRFTPGKGRNGTVRYLLEEVIQYEKSRLIVAAA